MVVLLAAMMAFAPAAGAKGKPDRAGPPGNNGTIKIDGVPGSTGGPGHSNNRATEGKNYHPDNDPHIQCGIEVEFFGFDQDQRAVMTFTPHAPTRSAEISFGDQDLEVDAAGEHEFIPTFEGEAHPKHGYHVKVTATVDDFQKHKVIWVEGCDPTPPEEDPCDTENPPTECPDPTS